MNLHRHPPMTPRHRVFLAVTVLSFLTVTGFVIGCDSDDGPKVTAPSGGSGSGTPTRNMTAEQQGRDGLEETENGTMIRNKGTVALNVRFNYDEPRHYRLNADTAMPSDPASAGSAPARVACGVPATGRANGQCFDNDGVMAPEPYSGNGNGSGGRGRNLLEGFRWYDSLKANSCVRISGNQIENICSDPISAWITCTTSTLIPDGVVEGIQSYRPEHGSVHPIIPASGTTIPGIVQPPVHTCSSGNRVVAACRGAAPAWRSSDPTQPSSCIQHPDLLIP